VSPHQEELVSENAAFEAFWLFGDGIRIFNSEEEDGDGGLGDTGNYQSHH
jgi:hypothetical protein